ncbi:MAG TPA: hydrolase Nlp/P60 [Xanthomonadaceae bacterium]|jgi:cell wall-associated NlpC family hydrolase|nr:hydrolase Nlp/P60 [Xanthomonadaceae bacterium]
MSRHNALPRHYAAAFAALLLAACASTPRDERAVPASEPLPLASPRTGAPKPLDLRADDVLMQAVALIGTRYRFGGTSPHQGFDCSGFTSYVFRESVGVQLPRTAADQFAATSSPVERATLRAGDLVFFQQGRRRVDHVGIYVGEGRFIHAPSRGGRVRIDALSNPHWTRTYKGARRPLADGD